MGSLRAEVRIIDMKQRTISFGTDFRGNADQIRSIAHRWADEIVYKLSAGASRGIASTKIAYVVRKGKAKEIYLMDYDGYNPYAFTQNGSLNLFPNWAPDNSKLAFTSARSRKWEINIYSYTDGSRLAFPDIQLVCIHSVDFSGRDANRLCPKNAPRRYRHFHLQTGWFRSSQHLQ